MASRRGTAKLIRQWELIKLLAGYRRGLTAKQIEEHTGIAHSTLYRYFAELRLAGIPLESQTVTGEARYTIFGLELPPLGPTPLQVAALRLARRGLVALDGTAAAVELDKLLDGYVRATGAADTTTFAKHTPFAPEIVRKLDCAIASQRRTRLRYRSVGAAAPSWRNVDPLGLRYVKGKLYFIAYDYDRAKYVPFKLDRITNVEALAEKAARHDDFDIHQHFAHSATIWTGTAIEVVVRLSPNVARFVAEYPLVTDQTVTDATDGSRIVRARVAGITEALRWVLSWGKEAEALEPAELRNAVAEEVTGAAERYARTKRGPRRAASALAGSAE